MSECSTNRFFGPVQTHIKMYQGSFVAVEGPNMTHKMNTLPNMKFPYQQILSARITLRAGQTNYLLNHLGLGDNATFLAITALYDEKSKFESDNYIQYSYFSNKNRLHSFAQMLVLTGNSENRIEQLYLHNPNQNSVVVLEVMVAIIDEYYNFFSQNGTDSGAQTNIFSDLVASDIALWDADDSVMVIKNNFNQPMAYLNISDLSTISLADSDDKTMIISDTADGTIILIFKTAQDAQEVFEWWDGIHNSTQ